MNQVHMKTVAIATLPPLRPEDVSALLGTALSTLPRDISQLVIAEVAKLIRHSTPSITEGLSGSDTPRLQAAIPADSELQTERTRLLQIMIKVTALDKQRLSLNSRIMVLDGRFSGKRVGKYIAQRINDHLEREAMRHSAIKIQATARGYLLRYQGLKTKYTLAIQHLVESHEDIYDLSARTQGLEGLSLSRLLTLKQTIEQFFIKKLREECQRISQDIINLIQANTDKQDLSSRIPSIEKGLLIPITDIAAGKAKLDELTQALAIYEHMFECKSPAQGSRLVNKLRRAVTDNRPKTARSSNQRLAGAHRPHTANTKNP